MELQRHHLVVGGRWCIAGIYRGTWELPCAYAANPRMRMTCACHAHATRNPNDAHAVRMPCAALIMRTPCACHAHAQVSRCACMRLTLRILMRMPWRTHACARACAWCARAHARAQWGSGWRCPACPACQKPLPNEVLGHFRIDCGT